MGSVVRDRKNGGRGREYSFPAGLPRMEFNSVNTSPTPTKSKALASSVIAPALPQGSGVPSVCEVDSALGLILV